MPASLDKLKKLGDRGLIIHELIDNESKYFFVLEEDWMRLKLEEPDEQLQQLAKLGAVVAQVEDSQGAFVDLAKLGVAEAHPEVREEAESHLVETEVNASSIVIHEEGTFYAIPRSAWKANGLPEGAEGDAGALVDRGAVAANIPDDDIPIGTFCVLVNLGLLNHPAR